MRPQGRCILKSLDFMEIAKTYMLVWSELWKGDKSTARGGALAKPREKMIIPNVLALKGRQKKQQKIECDVPGSWGQSPKNTHDSRTPFSSHGFLFFFFIGLAF